MEVKVAPTFFESLRNINSLKNKYYEVRAWFKYHFTKDFWKIVFTLFKTYPWDYSYLYELEQAKIKEMANYLKKNNRFVGVEYVVRNMNICSNLIDIFLGKTNISDVTGSPEFVKDDDNDTYSINLDNVKFNLKKHVNLKNINRFTNDEKQKEFYLKFPDEFYMDKAKYLYHKIRFDNDSTWWD